MAKTLSAPFSLLCTTVKGADNSAKGIPIFLMYKRWRVGHGHDKINPQMILEIQIYCMIPMKFVSSIFKTVFHQDF